MFRKNDTDISRTMAPPRRQKSYHLGCIQGNGKRAGQEDSFSTVNVFDVSLIKEEGLFFAVCDGMGGMQGGKLASDTAVECFREVFAALDRDGDINAQLRQGACYASGRIEALLGGKGGSTAVVCIVYQDHLYFVSVGDSFLYLKRGNMLHRMNHVHNMCNSIYLSSIRKGRMFPDDGRNDPETAALTSFLGMTGFEEADGLIRPMYIEEGDVLLACSDGVGGTLSNDEVYQALCLSDPQEMCREIERRIVLHDKFNQDNYTAVAVKCVV